MRKMNDSTLDHIAMSAAKELSDASKKMYPGGEPQKTAAFQCIVRRSLDAAREDAKATETNEQRKG